MSEVSPIIAQISTKVDALAGKLQEVRDEKKAIEKELGNLSNKLTGQQNEIADLKEQNKLLKMAGSINGTSENNAEMKWKINELVKEIDKCMALLNR